MVKIPLSFSDGISSTAALSWLPKADSSTWDLTALLNAADGLGGRAQRHLFRHRVAGEPCPGGRQHCHRRPPLGGRRDVLLVGRERVGVPAKLGSATLAWRRSEGGEGGGGSRREREGAQGSFTPR